MAHPKPKSINWKKKISFRLPDSYREFLAIHNGMGEIWISPYKNGSLKFLSVAAVAENWRHQVETEAQYKMNADVDLDEFEPDVDPQPAYWLPGWIPFVESG